MPITNEELNKLFKQYKRLTEASIVGITAEDLRISIVDWLFEIGELDHARAFSSKAVKFQKSPKIEMLTKEYEYESQQ